MSVQPMSRQETSSLGHWPSRLGLTLLLLIGACLAYVPFGLAARIPARWRLPLWIALAAGFLLAALLARHRQPHGLAWPALYAFFVAVTAQMVDWQFSDWLPRLLGAEIESPAGYGLVKLESGLLLAAGVLVLVKLAGGDLSSLYLKRGRIRWWLPIGLGTFAFFALTSLWAAEHLFGSLPVHLAQVGPWIPWIAMFVLANAFSEELLFRGLLLPRLAPLAGAGPAILVTTVAFALWHLSASYAQDMVIFLGVVFVLGLAWALITYKTDSLWGAVLFHAGTDIPIVLTFFAAM